MWKNILFRCSSKGARKVVLNRVGGAIPLIGIVIIVFIIIATYPPLLDSIA